MKISELEKLLSIMTEEEKFCKKHLEERHGEWGFVNAAYNKEGQIYVFLESGLAQAPVSIPGHEKAAEHYNFLNIVANKHTRYSVVPSHRHEFVEMNYILSGKVSFTVNDQRVEMVQGDLCIMDSNVTHQVMETGEKDIMLNIMMPKRYFNTAFLTTLMGMDLVTRFFGDVMSEKTLHDQYLLMHCQESESVGDLFERIFCEFLDPQAGSGNVIRYYIGLILIEAVRYYQVADAKGKKVDQSLSDVLQYIDEHCTTCTLQEVAEQFNYSPTHLSKKIKKEVGKSFQELVSEQRLNRVALQLENTDTAISEIAVTCGYQNMAFFYKKFFQQFNMTPKEFRRKVRK